MAARSETVGETGRTKVDNLSQSTVSYLKSFPKGKEVIPDVLVDSNNSTHIAPGSLAGIIEYDDVRLVFSTKVKTQLFYMMSFLKDETSFHYDPDHIIGMEGGEVFFDVIGRMFQIELNELFEKGLLKRYVTKEEDLNFLKGQLRVKEQVIRELGNRPRFNCRYFDLTCDNLENRVVLRALSLLIPMIKFSEGVRLDLICSQRRLLEEVRLDQGIGHSDCDRICLNRLNKHYAHLISLSRVIMQRQFIRSTKAKSAKGFNFLVGMNKLYEDFVTQMIREVVKEDFKEFRVLAQSASRTIDDDQVIRTKPDIILENKIDKTHPIIIDAKYKRSVANSDEYQLIAYSLAIPDSKVGCLLYPRQIDEEGKEVEKRTEPLRIRRDVISPSEERYFLFFRHIRLFEEEGEGYDEFIRNIKTQVRSLIGELLKFSEHHTIKIEN